MTYGELYLHARRKLLEEEPDTAGVTARDLVCTLSGLRTEEFLLSRDVPAEESVCRRIDEAIGRLCMGEPLAYVLGEWEFYGLPMYVTPDVLIPRDDTCAVTELAIQQSLFLEKAPRILDLCSGSGCIGLAIASRVRDARVTLGDISGEAAAVARKNITRNRMGGRVTCVRMDARAKPPEFLGKFDLIVSNPPYVTEAEMALLPDSVRNYEPHLALLGGKDGLDFYRDIVSCYTRALKPGGYLCFEFGMGQGDAVCRILTEHYYTIIERRADNQKIERAVLAQCGMRGE